jgi:hypothetical protein
MQTPEAASGAVAATWTALRRGLDASDRALTAVAERKWAALGVLVVGQWALVLAFALTVRHNGWVFYQGGDQIWLTTTGWLMGEGQVAPAYVGYAWPLVLAPITMLFGPGFVTAMPAVIALNVLVLGPLLLWAIHGLAEHVAGRVFALYATATWIVLPFAVIPLWRDDYHERYVEQFLPGALGLTGLADYQSLVLLTVAALLLLRSLSSRMVWTDAAAAGLIVGFAIGMKPSNALFLGGPALAALLARNLRPLVPFGLALLPALLALAVWKQRGLGTLPLFAAEEVRMAASLAVSIPDVDRYLDIDWSNLHDNMNHLREYFWSARLLQWLPFAGAFAVARRSLPAAGLATAWFAAFLLAKGSTPLSTVASGSFFRFVMPGFPAYFLLAVSTPLLVPKLGAYVAQRWPLWEAAPLGRRPLMAIAAVLATVPLLVLVALRPMSEPARAVVVNEILTPVDDEIAVDVRAEGEARIVSWTHPPQDSTDVFYRVYRTGTQGEDVDCIGRGDAIECTLEMVLLGTTREPTWRDGSPPPGSRYRIGIAANSKDDPEAGDVLLLSPPTAAG